MSRRRDLERELEGLSDIRGILDAMRNLALLETRKILRFIDAQRRSVATLAAAARDVAAFHRPPPPREGGRVIVLVGTERGFCGDFNEALVRALQAQRQAAGEPAAIVAVGGRLSSRLGEIRSALSLPGPTIAEDVDGVIGALSEGLGTLLGRAAEVSALVHDPESGEVQHVPLEPFPEPERGAPPRSAPRLNLAPEALLPQLAERYLLGRLQALLYGSLLAENERRMRHMDAAIRHLDEDRARLRAQRDMLRQEEITEEIEVIMLSAEQLRVEARG